MLVKKWKSCSVTIFALAGLSAFTSASEELFTQLDTNSDGVISKVESEAHSQLNRLFDSLDMNNDGVLSTEEFMANSLKK